MYNILGLESLPVGLVGRHLRRFPAAELQNPSPQSLSSALISSYRHGACGQRLPRFQTLSSATVTADLWRSEARADLDLFSHFVQNWTRPKIFIHFSTLHIASGTEAFWLTMNSQIFYETKCSFSNYTHSKRQSYKNATRWRLFLASWDPFILTVVSGDVYSKADF